MAIPAVNCTVYPAPFGSTAQGQLNSQGGISGAQSKSIIMQGTAVLDGSLTAFTANFIDGTQKLFQKTFVITALNVTAPATIGGVANQSIISGVGAFGALAVGASVVIAGFANSGNNGTFTVNAVTTSSITITNSSAVAETNNPSATVTANLGGHVLSVDGSRAAYSAAGVADSGTASIYVAGVSTITDASCLVTISAAGSNATNLSFMLQVFPTA